jgi:hypothetical protein
LQENIGYSLGLSWRDASRFQSLWDGIRLSASRIDELIALLEASKAALAVEVDAGEPTDDDTDEYEDED